MGLVVLKHTNIMRWRNNGPVFIIRKIAMACGQGLRGDGEPAQYHLDAVTRHAVRSTLLSSTLTWMRHMLLD